MKIKNIFGTAVALFFGFAVSSCTDDNDWGVDKSHDRLFATTSDKISVETTDAEPTQATVTFSAVPDAEYYIIEVSKDSLYDEVEMGGANAKVFEARANEGSSASTYVVTLTNLDSSSEYYLRIKSMAEGKNDSKWSYYKDGDCFKTKSEQIITSVVPGSKDVTVNFKPGYTVDMAYIYTSETDSTGTAVTSAEVEAGVITIDGLTPQTKYTVALYNGKIKRGYATFTTTEAYPDGYEIITLADGDDINAVLTAATSDKVVLVFPQGMSYTFPLNSEGGISSTSTTIPDNIKSVYFWGAAGAEKPTFTAKGLNCTGDKDLIRFYNLNLVNASSSSDYIINESSGVNIESVEIEKCNISKTRGVVRIQNTNAGSMNNVTVTDCVLTDIGSYGVFNAKGMGKVAAKAITISKTTINGLNASAIINTQQSGVKITVDQCTFYNCVQGGKSYFDVNKLTDITPEVTNTIIGPYYAVAEGTTVKGCSVKGQITFSSTYYTSDFGWNDGYELGEMIDATAAQLFVDPANGDFTIQGTYRGIYGAYGDPRWQVED